jgi:DNA polymerase III sliding clamp (beta) subunit (PCNA family)
MVKIVPANGSASEVRTAIKRLKVVCGNSVGYIAEGDFIKTNMPLTYCEVKVHPHNSIKPNIGTTELAEALNRVSPFVSKDKDRRMLTCVNFEAKEGKLNLIGADGFVLAVATLDYDDGEGQALVQSDELKGIASALRKARRARISFGTDENPNISLTLDTELIRYRWYGYNATYPSWRSYIPDKFEVTVHFDAIEALKALRLLKVVEYGAKSYPVDIVIGDGKMVLANTEDKAQVEVKADTDGEMYVRVDGAYLAKIFKAFGGMVDLKLRNPASPVLFSQDGYQVVLMPITSEKAKEYQAKAATTESQQVEAVAEAEAEATSEETEEPADEETEKPKRKRKAKESVAVA